MMNIIEIKIIEKIRCFENKNKNLYLISPAKDEVEEMKKKYLKKIKLKNKKVYFYQYFSNNH